MAEKPKNPWDPKTAHEAYAKRQKQKPEELRKPTVIRESFLDKLIDRGKDKKK